MRTTYPKRYIVRHRRGWKYKRAVPRELQPVLGFRAWHKYFGSIGEGAAEIEARAQAVDHDRLIAGLRKLTDAERNAIAAKGGLDAYIADARNSDLAATFIDVFAQHEPDPRQTEADQARAALDIMRARQEAAQLRATASGTRKTAAKVKSDGHASLEALIDKWIDVSPQLVPSSVDKVKLYTRRFVAAVGNLEPREVTRQHAMQYRDRVEKQAGISSKTAEKHLHALHRLFNVALSEGIVEANPFHGVKIKRAGRLADSERRKPFEAEQVRTIFKALDGASNDFNLMVRVLAYHGLRSGEAAQLRCEDVTKSRGIPVLSIHDKFGSVKNLASVRDVPIHPAMVEEIAARAETLGEGWLFPSFPTWKGKRSGWFQRYGGTFLRRAGIADKALTMHSFRHLWRTLAREVNMPEPVSRAIMGHALGKDDHAGYGSVPSLKKRARWMARIDPLVD